MNWREATVLITGGTGSFGRAFVKIMLEEFRPKKLIVFSRDELKQHEMQRVYPDVGDSPMRYFLGDVRDRDRLFRALAGVDVVVHAAALKQIPACEYNPIEAILTNVMGSRNVIEAAIDRRCKRVMSISSDKAVNPINLYGATKLCAEKLFVQSNSYSGAEGPRFSCVRYGNVIGSRGSVIPLFIEQRRNGCITITDPRMTRFWVTLEQGARFVIRCIEQMHGGEVFVPKIPSMNIMDLAKAVAGECEVRHIGIRPAEKLDEILISEEEARTTVELDDMFVVKPLYAWWSEDHWPEGRQVPEGFKYSSSTNSQPMSVEELRSICQDLA